jgi:hypothetical protein
MSEHSTGHPAKVSAGIAAYEVGVRSAMEDEKIVRAFLARFISDKAWPVTCTALDRIIARARKAEGRT